MTLNYEKLIATRITDIERVYSDVETMLYAQSVGFGRNAIDRKELPYVYEQGGTLLTVPTMASAIVPDMFPPNLGWVAVLLECDDLPVIVTGESAML